jgi:hypothetical protein
MARRSPPRKVTYFEPVPPRLPRNTVIESTFEVGSRFRCTMRVDCGQLGSFSRPIPERARAAVRPCAPGSLEVVGSARSDAFAAQLLHAGTDHWKIVRSAGWGHAHSVFCDLVCDYPAAVTGSTRDGSLFLTLPTRPLTGQQIMPSEG